MSFASLKKQKGNFAELSKRLEQDQSGGFTEDQRFWKFEVDKAGNGFAVIRFLPPVDGEEIPYVRIYEHSFKDPRTGKWYIENCRTTLGRGEPDPCCEANNELWNSGVEAHKEIARKRKRNARYIMNILVISDPKNPSNEGKNFLWKCGPRIFQKIELALKPPSDFPDEKPYNPFDFWTGANFKLKARMVDGNRSYDLSAFEAQKPLFDDDDALEVLWKKQYPLLPEVAAEKFKSYDDLKKKFQQVIGEVGVVQASGTAPTRTPPVDDIPSEPQAEAPARRSSTAGKSKPTSAPAEDVDADLARYASLLDE